MARNEVDIVIRAVDEASKALDAAQRELDQLEKSADRAAGAGRRLRKAYQDALGPSRAVMGAVAAAGTAALGAAGYMVTLAARMEQTEIAFGTLLGNAEAAQEFLQDLSDLAGSTPFQLPGLQQASRLLLAFGFNAQDAIPIVRTLGDTVSALGGGDAELQGVIRAIGQIQAKGKVSAEELLQLAERGIPAYQILQEELGLTGEEVANIGTMGIDATTGINALLTGLSDRFAGAMEAQSRTILGLFSNVQDEVTRISTIVGGQLMEALNLDDALQGAIDTLANLRTRIEEVGIGPALEGIADQAYATAGALMGAMVPAVINLAVVFARATLRLAPWAAAGLIATRTIQALGVKIEDVMPFVNRLALGFQGVTRIVLGLVDGIAYFISATLDRFMGMVNFIDRVQGVMRDLKLAVESNAMTGQEAVEALTAYVDTAWRQEFDALPASVSGMMESAEGKLTQGAADLVGAVTGTGDEVAELLSPTLDIAQVVADETTRTLAEFQGLTTGLDDGLQDVASGLEDVETAADGAAAAIGRIPNASGAYGLPAAAVRGANAGEAYRIAQDTETAMAPQRRAEAQAQAEAASLEALDRIMQTHASVANAIAQEANDAVNRYGQTLEDLNNLWRDSDDAARQQIRRRAEARLALEAEARAEDQRLDAADAARQANADAAEAIRRQAAAADASVEALARLESSYAAIPAMAAATAERQMDAIFTALGDYDPAAQLAGGTQYGTGAGIPGGPTAAEIRRAQQDAAIFGAAGDYDPSQRTGSQYGERGSQIEREAEPSAAAKAIKAAGEAASIFGESVANAAREAVPALDAAITGFAQGGPLGALAAVLGEALMSSEAFAGIMERLGGILTPVIEAMTKVLDALWPIIDVAIALVETALQPVIWILEHVVAPVFTAVAKLVVGIWNAIANALNWALGWLGVNIRTIDLDDAAPRPSGGPEEDDNRPRATGSSGSGEGGNATIGSAPPAVQFAVYTPLVEAATDMARAAELLADTLAERRASDTSAMGRFTTALERATPVLDRLADGITITMASGDGSRTAPTRLTALR